jgi:hypothetical protein
MPKCPACLVLLLAPLGIKVPGSKWFLAYAVLMAAALPLAFFVARSCRRCGMRPLITALTGMAATGMAAMTIGRVFVSDGAVNLAVSAAGVLMVFGAILWAGRLASAAQVCAESHS